MPRDLKPDFFCIPPRHPITNICVSFPVFKIFRMQKATLLQRRLHHTLGWVGWPLSLNNSTQESVF